MRIMVEDYGISHLKEGFLGYFGRGIQLVILKHKTPSPFFFREASFGMVMRDRMGVGCRVWSLFG